MYKYILVLLSLLPASLLAQQQARIINSCGNNSNSSGILLKTSVGEPIVGKLSSSSIVLSQGFLQIHKRYLPLPEIDISAHIYPNPTSGRIFVQSNLPVGCIAEIISITGQQIARKVIVNNSIDLSRYPSAMYILRIVNSKGELIKISKIVKY